MFVRDVMSSPAVTIQPDDRAVAAAQVLDRLSLTCLPVVDHDRRLLGILSEADVVARLAADAGTAEGDPHVSDLMTRRVLSVEPDDDLAAVMDLMTGTVLKSLPVMLHERVIGMVSRRDVVRAFAHGELDADHAAQLAAT